MMLDSVSRILVVSATATSLLIVGCSSAGRSKTLQLYSSSPSSRPEPAKAPESSNDLTGLYEREFPDQASLIKSGKEFTITPPGFYTPLPPGDLLGAPSLHERDGICETIIRHLASKRCDVQPVINYRFIGFQGREVAMHDPSKELLQRIRDMKLPVEPVSTAKESRMSRGVRVDSEQAEYGMQYFIVYIQVENADHAEVGVNEMPGFSGAGERFTYSLVRSNGQWTITKEEPGPVF